MSGEEPQAEDAGSDGDYTASESDDDDDDNDDGEYRRLVVDIGYGTTQYGLAGNDNITPKCLRNTHDNEGKYAHAINRSKLDLMNVNWEQMESMWEWIFEKDLKVESDECCVISTVSPYGPRAYAEKLAEMLFETHEVPGIYLGVPAVFCLYAQGMTTGVVVDSGECITSAIPVYDGIPIASAAKQLNFGGRDISAYLERHLQTRGVDVKSLADLNIVDTIKKEVCVCGVPADDGHETYEMPDGKKIEIDADFPVNAAQQFFFNPLQLDWDDTDMEEALHDVLHSTIMNCPMDSRRDLWGNTILTGGNTMFKGFAESLYKKLKPLPGCRNVNLKIKADAARDNQAWVGASVVASMDSFMNNLIPAEVYDEEGPEVVHKLNIFSL